MKLIILSIILFLFVIGLMVPSVFAEEQIPMPFPSWIKFTAGVWVDGKSSDSEFINAIQFLIADRIIVLPPTTQGSSSGSNEIPAWIKFTAGVWANGQSSDAEFINALQFLIKNGIAGTNDKESTIFPNSIKVQKESTIFGVKFSITNTDDISHTFSSGTISDYVIGTVFDSGLLVSNDTYTYGIEYAGEIPYFCMVHPWEQGILKISNDDLYLLNQEIERERIEKEQERLELEKEETKKQKFNDIAFYFYDSMDYILLPLWTVPTLDEIRSHFGEEKYQLLEDRAKRINEEYDYNDPTSYQVGMALSLEEKAFEIEMMEYSLNSFNQDMSERFVKVGDLFEDVKQQISNFDISEEEKLQYIKEIQNQKDSQINEIMRGLKAMIQVEEDIAQMKKELEYEVDLRGESLEFDSSICGEGTIMKNGQCVVDSNLDMDPELSSKGGGCLIATATYGSEMAQEVQQLRELRDNSLLNTEAGSAFMNSFNDVYYSFSPYIADYERENPVFREMVKIAITPMISSLSILNYVDMNSEIEVLGYGISLIILNLGMYLGVPAVVIIGIRKRF